MTITPPTPPTPWTLRALASDLGDLASALRTLGTAAAERGDGDTRATLRLLGRCAEQLCAHAEQLERTAGAQR